MTRSVATAQAIKGGENQVGTRQQRVRLALDRTGHQVEAHGVQVYGQVHVDESNQGWKVDWLATPHQDQRQEVLSYDKINSRRASEPNE